MAAIRHQSTIVLGISTDKPDAKGEEDAVLVTHLKFKGGIWWHLPNALLTVRQFWGHNQLPLPSCAHPPHTLQSTVCTLIPQVWEDCADMQCVDPYDVCIQAEAGRASSYLLAYLLCTITQGLKTPSRARASPNLDPSECLPPPGHPHQSRGALLLSRPCPVCML